MADRDRVDLPGHMLELLQDEDELVLFRARRLHGEGSVLLRTGADDPPSVAATERIEHEHRLAGLLDPGWAICRSIVEAHGGSLWALPRSPHGSLFQFSLPAGQS